MGSQSTELDLLAEPLLGIRPQDGEGNAVSVLEVDLNGVGARIAEADIGDDATGPDVVALSYDSDNAELDHVGGDWPLVAGVWSRCDHLDLAGGADRDRLRKELAVSDELLFG